MLSSPAMEWTQALPQWRAWLTAAGRPATTTRLRIYQMTRFAADHPRPWAVTTDQIIEWLAAHDWSAESRRSYRSALVTFYRWGVDEGHLLASPADRIPAVRPARHAPRPAPETVVQAAILTADSRTRLMLSLAARCGLRRGEISRLHSRDLMAGPGGAWSLRVHGKGDKIRVIPCGSAIADEIRARPSGWVFPGVVGWHLSADRVGAHVAGSAARVDGAHAPPPVRDPRLCG